MKMKITSEMLWEHGACAADIAKFEAEWPQGCEVTLETCIRAFCELGLDPNWAARNLLMPSAKAEYERIAAPARAEYERITAPAWAEYERIGAEARAEYERITAEAFYSAWKMG